MGKEDWILTFGIMVQQLWNIRNRSLFDQDSNGQDSPIIAIKQYVLNVKNVLLKERKGHIEKQYKERMVAWNLHYEGWIKINTNKASKGNPRLVGFGGMSRDLQEGGWKAFQLIQGTYKP